MEAVQDALQNAIQRGFFTGLSNRNGTKPGFAEENETFLVKFDRIQIENLECDNSKRVVKDRFESSYDWEPIMEMILDCLEDYDDLEDFDIDCQTSIMVLKGVTYIAW